MREINFRAWDKKRGKMFFDIQDAYDGHNDLPEDSFGLFLGRRNFCRAPHSEYEVMQFTGLKDKNGKEIYEGDILEFKSAGYINSVVWDSDLARWALDDWHVDWYDEEDRNKFEVIGNIYENPELLKKS